MVQGRPQFDAMDCPVAVGGVQVAPGDVIVADGDRAIAVPAEAAEDVARYAHEEQERDKKGRGTSYEDLGWKKDATVS
jgi:4-hydroxy-4-methyl-2-oxoglutarate aldolase